MLKEPRSDRDWESVFKSTFKVMVIDHNKDLLNYVCDLLNSHSFEVTWVENAGDALRILSVKKDKFDLLLIDSDLREVDVSTFLRLTKDMNILSMVMREEAHDDKFLLKMIKNGAFLVIKRPLTDDVVFQARQHVIRERMHKLEKFKMFDESFEPESANFGDRRKDKCDARKNVRKFYDIENPDIQQLDNESNKRIFLEWTEELHGKFLRAVHKLGEGNCIPKAIADTMEVPGLTRMQVASHLQKCRKEGWNFNNKRGQTRSSNDSTFSNNISQGLVFRRYGRMPHVPKHVDNQQERNTHIDATYSSNGVCISLNHMNNQSFHDSSVMNGFEFQNRGQVFSVPSSGQDSCDSSLMNGFGSQNSGQVFSVHTGGHDLMNGFGLQNNGQLFSIPSSGQGFDSLLMNGFGLQNSGQLFSAPNAGEGSSSHVFPPNQRSDNFFDFGNDIHGNESLSCIQPNVFGENYDSISEHSYYGQVIPNQGT